MELKFKFIDEKHIKIIAVGVGKDFNEEREVGQIFTPSGSGELYKNAIQICGFSEAFDLWGCGIYAEPVIDEIGINYVKDKYGRKVGRQAKDIQLYFGYETIKEELQSLSDGCLKCFSNPCSCEVKIRGENPYTVKRSQDLPLEKIEEPKEVKKDD